MADYEERFEVRRGDTVLLLITVELRTKPTVTLGSPTAGTFTLSFGGQTTSALAYNATSTAVQAALQALTSIGNGRATVTGAAGGPYAVVLADAVVTADRHLTGSGAGLTAGAFLITEGQDIAAWQKFWLTGKRALSDVDASAIFQKTSPAGGLVVTTPGSGLITATLSPSDWSTLPNRRNHVYADVQGKDSAGNIQTLKAFTFVVSPESTLAIV